MTKCTTTSNLCECHIEMLLQKCYELFFNRNREYSRMGFFVLTLNTTHYCFGEFLRLVMSSGAPAKLSTSGNLLWTTKMAARFESQISVDFKIWFVHKCSFCLGKEKQQWFIGPKRGKFSDLLITRHFPVWSRLDALDSDQFIGTLEPLAFCKVGYTHCRH